MKTKVISSILIVAAIGLGVISWFLLPDVVAVQIGLDGQVSNTMPKALAVAVPMGISIVGSVMNLISRDGKNSRGFLLSLLGLTLMAVSLLVNRYLPISKKAKTSVQRKLYGGFSCFL